MQRGLYSKRWREVYGIRFFFFWHMVKETEKATVIMYNIWSNLKSWSILNFQHPVEPIKKSQYNQSFEKSHNLTCMFYASTHYDLRRPSATPPLMTQKIHDLKESRISIILNGVSAILWNFDPVIFCCLFVVVWVHFLWKPEWAFLPKNLDSYLTPPLPGGSK